MTEKRVELIRRADESGTLVIDATLKTDGSLEVFFHDIGDAAEEAFGDRDYEHWVTVSSEYVDALALALVKHSWSCSIHAVSELKELCQANGINAEEHSF
ncbi:hypothetical protein GRI38_10655 [Altererythrobacter aurantiacus]|uniref:Uncharacterized protein n=1 Tax=Parapontixanthobacter aurantiacus TaxID=1463599 RepID=A0A844ZG10_9SPHN|nr:hypothetical protein [Parapontixanthobacter aurantiacus]MXO86484.1 hypothetical protein [Parapontixanthobacter aurantiacus]